MFRSWTTILFISLIIILYPTAPSLLYIIGVPDKDQLLGLISIEAPYMHELYANATCGGATLDRRFATYLIVAVLHILLIIAVGAYFVKKIFKLLAIQKSSLPGDTYKMHKNILFSVILQAILPFIFVIFPFLTCFIVAALNLPNARSRLIYNQDSFSAETLVSGV